MSEASSPTILPAGETNALGRMIGLLGDEWTLLILEYALRGVKRYGQFRDVLHISYAVLTARMEALVQASMLERRVYQHNPVRAEYVLTPRGRSVWPVLLSIWDWERRWVPEHVEPLPAMRHTVCGQEFAPRLCCSNCDKQVQPSDLLTRWGPSGSWDRSVPAASTRRRSESRNRGAGLFPETMAVFGNRWSSALVGAAFRGVRRFGDLQTALSAPPSLLAERLQALCEHGVLEPVRLEERPDWAEYHLTAKGHAFFPVVATALQWAEQWYRAPEGPAMLWTHRECGADFVGKLVCDQCATPLTGGDVQVV